MGKEHLIVGVYMDDLIITRSRQGNIDGFKREIVAKCRMSILSLLIY
jgi:hypothetical protein